MYKLIQLDNIYILLALWYLQEVSILRTQLNPYLAGCLSQEAHLRQSVLISVWGLFFLKKINTAALYNCSKKKTFFPFD